MCVTGSQKGLMLPAGLGILCVSQKALALTSSAGLKRDYFDLDIMLNANNDFVCYDHGALLLEALTPRYGRQPVLDVLRTMMTPEQYGVLLKTTTLPTCIRRRFIVYVRCVMDLIQGTLTSPTVDVVIQGRTFSVTPTMRWSQLVQAMPKGTKLGLASDAQQAMLDAGQDFLLEELRAGTIQLTVG